MEVFFNNGKHRGKLSKLTESNKLHKLRCKYNIELEDRIEKIYKWYLK